jgi:hypothetical protein
MSDIVFQSRLVPTLDDGIKKVKNHVWCVTRENIPLLKEHGERIGINMVANKGKMMDLLNQIRRLYFNNETRFCRGFGGYIQTREFVTDTDMLVFSYTKVESNYFITGYATVKIEDWRTFEIKCLCSDLHFSGIGSHLMTIIKKLGYRINPDISIVLESLSIPDTQNFYTSQGFAWLGLGKPWFEWHFTGDEKDRVKIGKQKGDFFSTYHKQIRRSSSLTELLPYNEYMSPEYEFDTISEIRRLRPRYIESRDRTPSPEQTFMRLKRGSTVWGSRSRSTPKKGGKKRITKKRITKKMSKK